MITKSAYSMQPAQGEFLLKTGSQLKEEGCNKVLTRNQKFKEDFFFEADYLLWKNGEVTSEDIINKIGMPHSPNAVGAAMRAWAKSRGAKITNYRPSTRPSTHAAVIGVWKLIPARDEDKE